MESVVQLTFGAVVATILLAMVVTATIGSWPGHSGGGFYPLYIPEHYGVRNSQHLWDPYTYYNN